MPTSSRTRGPYRKGVERRREIIVAAAQLFGESGYTHASMRELAKRVGLSQPLLLHYFSNKEDLLVEVLNLRDAHVAEYLADIADADVATRSRRVARHAAEHEGLTSLYVALSAEAIDPDHPAHQYFVDHYEAAQRLTREPGVENGEVPAGVSPELVSTLGIAMMEGLQIQRQYLTDIDGVAVVDAFWETVAAARSWWALTSQNPDVTAATPLETHHAPQPENMTSRHPVEGDVPQDARDCEEQQTLAS